MPITYDHAECKGRDKSIRTIGLINPTQQLTINTYKTFNGKLTTSATVGTLEGGFITHQLYQDFSQRLEASDIRVTAKNMRDQHTRYVDNWNQIQDQAIAHYTPKETK
jgi:hypothetical protein